MIEISRRLQFSAGHRVFGHESKCKHPHGHNYVVHLHARAREAAPELDHIGRVVDFGVLKERIGTWIERNWDHAFIVWAGDVELLELLRKLEAKTFVLPLNPTAENIGRYLAHEVCPRLIDDPIEVHRVDIEETENCIAIIVVERHEDVRS